MLRLTLKVAAAACLLPAAAIAQPVGPGGFGAQSKTDAIGAFDGLRQGLESVVRAASQSSSSGPSSPLVDSQTAQSMSYDNQIKATNTYFQKRQLNRSYRQAERGPQYTAAEYRKWARERAPDRLNSSQVDRYTGRINWPVVLKGESYRKRREQLDQLYASHTAGGGGMNTSEYAKIQRLSKEMQTQLKDEIKDLTPEQYSYTRKFLEGLRYEARQGV